MNPSRSNQRGPARAVTLGLSLAVSLAAQGAKPETEDALHPEVQQALTTALAAAAQEDGSYAVEHDALFAKSALHHGTQTRLLAELQRRAESFETPEPVRRQVEWIRSWILWRQGDLATAQEVIGALRDQLYEESPVLAVTLRHAKLLDAIGKVDEAEEAYREALSLSVIQGPELEGEIRLRLALFSLDQQSAGGDGPKPQQELVDFASEPETDPTLRNRAANVLALTGREQEAVDLFRVNERPADGSESSKWFREEARRAEWALRAKDWSTAQEYAWEARGAARLRRDRRYALTLLVEAHRGDESINALIERFAKAENLDDESREVWIDLLRETGQVDEAVRLFRDSATDFTVEMQRQLVETYRESGRDEEMVATYESLIEERPESLEWRRGLARYHLEQGNREAAVAVWRSYLEEPRHTKYFLAAAEAMSEQSLLDLGLEAIETSVEADVNRYPALLLLFDLQRERGDLEAAQAALVRIDEMAAADDSVRVQVAEAYERIGRADRAVELLENLKAARGGQPLAEDLEMRLAWLYSEIGDEDKAFDAWKLLWKRVTSVPRRRYAEDRLMTVGSRIGKIADVAIELEQKLQSGEADDRDAGLLVRLYTKINDSVSATEVIDEFMTSTGRSTVDALTEKATVYLACTDYASYEDTLRELIEADPKGEAEYLRNLVMSMLERGRPAEARPVLARLKELDGGSDASEFEAGVFALAGLRDEAIDAYWKGIANHPDRIEIYLLLGNLLRDAGQGRVGIGMFQHVAETAARDDLFTIAIDGLLNLQAPSRVLRWARRTTLERLARSGDKIYLYRLLADLSDELGESVGARTALEGTLAIAGTQRASIVRELMDMAGARGRNSDPAARLAYGRRLIGLGEIVPPGVYLDLGKAFLAKDDVSAAMRTFGLASSLPDYESFQRDVAKSFEDARFLEEALRIYQGVLVGDALDVSLITKVGEMHEQIGQDQRANELYQRALDLLLARRPLRETKAEKEEPRGFFANRNVDDYDQYAKRVIDGLVTTFEDEEAAIAFASQLRDELRSEVQQLESEDAGLPESLKLAPRLAKRAGLYRRLTSSFGRIDLADSFDLELLAKFVKDESLLEDSVRYRIDRGYTASATELFDRAERSSEQKASIAALVGRGEPGDGTRFTVGETARLILPNVRAGDRDQLAGVLRRLDPSSVTDEDEERFGILMSAASWTGETDAVALIAQTWIQRLLSSGNSPYQIERVLKQCQDKLPEERQKGLVQFIASQIFADVEKSKNLLRLLPTLQKAVEEPLAEPEELLALLEEQKTVYPYGIVPVLELLPEDQRTAAMRTIWPKVPQTQRASFITNVIQEFKEPIGEDVADFLVGAYPDALKDVQTFYWYQVERLGDNTEHPELLLRLAEILCEREPEKWECLSLRAGLLKQVGREKEAVEAGIAALSSRLSAENDYEWTRAVDKMAGLFFPEFADRFVEAIEQSADASPRSALRQITLLRQIGQPSETIAALRKAVESHPKDLPLREALQRELQSNGDRVAAVRAMEGQLPLIDNKQQRDRLQRRIVTTWNGLGNPVEALRVAKIGREEETEKEDKKPDEKKPELTVEKAPVASINEVKKAVDKEEFDAARETFRRVWRTMGQRGGGVRYVFINGQLVQEGYVRALNWPVQRKAEPIPPEVAQARKRGGLDAFLNRFQPKPVERTSAYTELAAYEFGREEIRRQRRSVDASSLNGVKPLLPGLERALIEERGLEGAIDHLLGLVGERRADAIDFALLSGLIDKQLAEDPSGESAAGKLQTVVDQLSRTVEPDAPEALRRLARLSVTTGDVETAERVLRWCATLASADYGALVTPQDLIADIRELFDGEKEIDLIETVLRSAEPGDSPWQRASFENLVLETWESVLGPERAVEKCRDLCEQILDVSEVLRRDPAQRAAVLLARTGELDLAIRCLEIALCKLPTEGVSAQYFYLSQYERPGYLSDPNLERLLPELDEDATEEQRTRQLEWVERCASAILGWNAEGRLNRSVVVRSVSVAIQRLAAADRKEAAAKLFEQLRAVEDTTANDDLWIADAARLVDRKDAAVEIERDLLDRQSLRLERIPGVISGLRETAGAEQALEVGQGLTEWTRDEAILDQLTKIAEDLGDEDGAKRWREAKQEAVEARKELGKLGMPTGSPSVSSSRAVMGTSIIRIR